MSQLRDSAGAPKGPPYAYFSESQAAAAKRELRGILPDVPSVVSVLKRLYANLPTDPCKRRFKDGVCLFLDRQDLRESYPIMSHLMELSLMMPLANASPERLFSLLKLLKTRIRASMADDSLDDSFTVNLVTEDCEVNGLPLDDLVELATKFIDDPKRRVSFASLKEFEATRDWIVAYRKSQLD